MLTTVTFVLMFQSGLFKLSTLISLSDFLFHTFFRIGYYKKEKQLASHCNLRIKQPYIKSNRLTNPLNVFSFHIFAPTPLEGGGTIYSNWFFFVQSIFADRYIHRRELILVSLESSSSVKYGIKKIFLIFVFYRELSRFSLNFREK